ncbi:hypothetical protein [Bosea sp. BIWAKO-01]|uniref:hypothetical protein n=1 Tax=Bosea sp. BIWAKO-01 TaxID=506668 RepID=UPI00114CF112|nr:hypothetical protein [Bosea sp. BIWAKO-01]
MSAPVPTSLSGRLPPDLRQAWERVESDAFGLLGRTRSINALVARHHRTFEALIDGGLRHQDLVALMAEAGIQRADGSKVSENAVAAAISRARRALGANAARSHERPAHARIDSEPLARARPVPAADPSGLQVAGPDPPEPVEARSARQEPSGVISRSHANANLRVARLLNQLGEQHD